MVIKNTLCSFTIIMEVILGNEHNEYSVELERDGLRMEYSGVVRPIIRAISINTNEVSILYQNKHNSNPEEKLSDECRVVFEFNYCWRGCWEGRIYFKDDEYWSEELSDMSEFWLKLEQYLKYRIREDNPDYGYFDK